MSDEESSQGDDAGEMFTPDAILGSNDASSGIIDDVDEMGDDNNNNTKVSSAAAAAAAANAALLQGLLARKKATKMSSSSKRSITKRSSSSSRTRPVVKLMVTSVSRSYSEPWRRKPQRESSGTGFLISWENDSDSSNCNANGDTTAGPTKHQPIRIVTNAHVVRNATTVRARASFGPHVVSCEVEWLSLPLDLALLRITEGDWHDFCKGWSFDNLLLRAVNSHADYLATNVDGATNNNINNAGTDAVSSDNNNSSSNNNLTKLLTLSTGLPKLDENVTCVGFPQGGTQISVTRGVVSRIDVDSQYVLRIQIDAAINPGNSGGVSGHCKKLCLLSDCVSVVSNYLYLKW